MLNYFDPRLPRDRRPAEAWWALNGAAMKARGEILDKVSFNDIFDLSYIETEGSPTR